MLPMCRESSMTHVLEQYKKQNDRKLSFSWTLGIFVLLMSLILVLLTYTTVNLIVPVVLACVLALSFLACVLL